MSSIWNSEGSSFLKCARIESKLRNIFSRSRFSPVTLEIWNIGHTLRKKNTRLLPWKKIHHVRDRDYDRDCVRESDRDHDCDRSCVIRVNLTVCLLGSQFRDWKFETTPLFWCCVFGQRYLDGVNFLTEMLIKYSKTKMNNKNVIIDRLSKAVYGVRFALAELSNLSN